MISWLMNSVLTTETMLVDSAVCDDCDTLSNSLSLCGQVAWMTGADHPWDGHIAHGCETLLQNFEKAWRC